LKIKIIKNIFFYHFFEKIGPGRDAMLGRAFLIKFDAFGELAMSPRFSCIRSGHLNTTNGNLCYSPRYAGHINKVNIDIK
jgi:hypothetical protein